MSSFHARLKKDFLRIIYSEHTRHEPALGKTQKGKLGVTVCATANTFFVTNLMTLPGSRV